MKNLLKWPLSFAARKVLRDRRPRIIGITGSIGKSSTRDAIHAVLSQSKNVRASEKNYNTEIGVPLTILGLPGGEGSPLRWLWILWRALIVCLYPPKHYPEVLVLEMGMRHPGDISELCDIAKPDVAVITTVGESHLELMGSIDNIAKEKAVLVRRLVPNGITILNRDDERVWEMRHLTTGKIASFGFASEADVRCDRERISHAIHEGQLGLQLTIVANDAVEDVFLPRVVGRHSAYPLLAATAVGLAFGLSLKGAVMGLRAFRPPPGRVRCLPGIHGSMVIDDTYNASPASTVAGLELLREIPIPGAARRYAILGDMLELGEVSQSGHELVGASAASCADVLIFVGERMKGAMASALAGGAREEQVFWFSDADSAIGFLRDRIDEGFCIFVKGSRGMRMERVVRALVSEPG